MEINKEKKKKDTERGKIQGLFPVTLNYLTIIQNTNKNRWIGFILLTCAKSDVRNFFIVFVFVLLTASDK